MRTTELFKAALCAYLMECAGMAYGLPLRAAEHAQAPSYAQPQDHAQTPAHTQAYWQTLRIVFDRHGEWTASHAWQQSLSHDVTYLRHAHDAVHSDGARVVWAAWSLPDSITHQLPVWLGVHLPVWADVQLWIRWNKGEWQALALEHEQHATEWGEGHLLPVWAIHDSSLRQIDLLVRIEHLSVFQLPLVLLKPELFLRAHWKPLFIAGVLLALLVLLNLHVLSQLRFLPKRTWLLSSGMLLTQAWVLCWLNGLLTVLWPSLSRANAAVTGETSVWLWMLFNLGHVSSSMEADTKHVCSRLRLWQLLVFEVILGPLCWRVFPEHKHHILSVALLAQLGLVLAISIWQPYQKSQARPHQLTGVWGLYVLSLLVFFNASHWPWHPTDTFLAASFFSLAASAWLASAGSWKGMIRQDRLRRQLRDEMRRNRWYALAQHDLWQPLKSVQLYAHALEQAAPGQQPRLLKGMQLAAQHAEDFMLHFRMGSEQHQAGINRQSPYQWMSADALLSPLVTECMSLAHWHRVSLHYRKNASRLNVDAPAVQRMLRNLIHNALTYTPAGGRVLVGCRRQAGYLWILCADNGKGMSARQLALCTQAYGRLEPIGHHLDQQGLGLFSFCQLAQQMNLPLRMTSTPDKGSIFGFAIPLA